MTVRASKTDQYRQGDRVMVARTGSPTYPVSMMEHYFHLASMLRLVSTPHQATVRHPSESRQGLEERIVQECNSWDSGLAGPGVFW